MAARTVFCSYARGDAEAVRAIAVELDQLGQHAWIDQKLTGGQSWWDTILGRIRACDCFLFALSDASLRSKACQAELDYAHRLGRTILPVAVGPVIDALLPPHLAEIQRIEAGDTRMLARALLGLPPTPPLPDPLPAPPPVPITYLNSLAAILDREELTPADQRDLEGSLKQRLANPEERDAAVALLKRLRQHPSVTAFVAGEIDADLAAIAPPAPPPPAPPSRPVPEYRNPSPAYASARPQPGGSRVGTVAALVLVVVLALGGLAVWLLASGGDDGNGGDGSDVSTQNEGSTGGGEGGTTGGGGRTTTTSRGTTTESTDNEVRPTTTEGALSQAEGGSAQP